MEILDQLEQRISDLLARLERVQTENRQFHEVYSQEISALTKKNASLKDELELERQQNLNALERIEKLLQKLKECSSTE